VIAALIQFGLGGGDRFVFERLATMLGNIIADEARVPRSTQL